MSSALSLSPLSLRDIDRCACCFGSCCDNLRIQNVCSRVRGGSTLSPHADREKDLRPTQYQIWSINTGGKEGLWKLIDTLSSMLPPHPRSGMQCGRIPHFRESSFLSLLPMFSLRLYRGQGLQGLHSGGPHSHCVLLTCLFDQNLSARQWPIGDDCHQKFADH